MKIIGRAILMGDKKKNALFRCSIYVQVALFTLLVKCAGVDSANRGQETYGRGTASDPTYCVSSTTVITLSFVDLMLDSDML